MSPVSEWNSYLCFMTSNTQGISPFLDVSAQFHCFSPISHHTMHLCLENHSKILILLITLMFVIISLKCPGHLLYIHEAG